MNGYSKAALRALDILNQSAQKSPAQAWKNAVAEIYPSKPAARDKGCPKGAFLGLCSAGLVAGVPEGKYTNSRKNSAYAIKAVEALRANPDLAEHPSKLWEKIQEGERISHNGQLDVVICLWFNGYVRS